MNDRAAFDHQPSTIAAGVSTPRVRSISANELTVFTRQLATLVSAGVPLLQSLESIHKGLSGQAMAPVVNQLQHHISAGLSLKEALQQHDTFSALYCQMVAAGELSGNLEDMLNRLAWHTERQQQLRRKVRMALVYPLAVLLVALGVVAVILVWVVPVFQSIFASFGADLPWATQLILGLSDALLQWGLPAVGAALSIAWLVRRRYRTDPSFQWLVAVYALRQPLLGTLMVNTNLAVWTRCMAMLMQSGVPLLDTLETVAGACSNRVYGLSTLRVREAVFKGIGLAQALRQLEVNTYHPGGEFIGLYPPILVQMIDIGEQSGSLSALLIKAADAQDEALEQQVHSLTQLIEPLMVVVLGGLVGAMVIALYLPVFQLGQVM
ncbi:MAG: type II secretion system F family protein [Limnohabitans sp.]